MKNRVFVTLLLIFTLSSAAFAIDGYKWDMSKTEAEAMMREIGRATGITLKLVKESQSVSVYQGYLNSGAPVGSTVLRFDENGGLNAIGSTLPPIRGTNEANDKAATAIFNALAKSFGKGEYALLRESADRAVYLSKKKTDGYWDKITIFKVKDGDSYVVGVSIEKRE